MGILRLDNDIFLMIFDEIGLPEVVNFLRVNRRLHILGHKLLKDHQDLIKRYTTVCINPGSAFDPDFKFSYVSSHPADLLVEVADRPLIASYIRSVTLGELPRSPEMIALRARGAAKLHAHRIFDRLREVGRLYTALSRYQVGVPATAEEAHKLRDEGYDHVQEGEYGGLIKASLCLLLMQLTHLQCLDFCNISSALMSLTFANSVREGSQGYGRQGKCYILSSLPLEKIEFLRDDHQNLRKHPEPKFVTGVAGTLTVRVRSFDKETYSCNWRNILPKLLDTRGGLRELAFRGDYLARGPSIRETYRVGRSEDELTMEQIYDRLTTDREAVLHQHHRVVELHGTFPDQELRIVKRDDIDWGECKYDDDNPWPERPWWER